MPRVTVDPEGYLRTIPRGVFRTEDVFRELVCNSIQACDLARQVHERNKTDYTPFIRVTMPSPERIVVEDNGVGFHPDILPQLGNVQASKWGLAEDKLKLVTTERNATGIFGMGLASLFLLAEQVEIQTVYAEENGRPMRHWWTNWKEWYTWSGDKKPNDVPDLPPPQAIPNHGSRVVLGIRSHIPADLDWNEEDVRDFVRLYFSAHEVPILVGNDEVGTNEGIACWDMAETETRSQIGKWLKSRNMPTYNMPESSFFCHPVKPYDGISGCLWFNPGGADVVYLFARRVFADQDTELFPFHRQFMTVAINDDKAVLDIRKRAEEDERTAVIATEQGKSRAKDIMHAIHGAIVDYVRWLCSQYAKASPQQKIAIQELGRKHGHTLLAYLLHDADNERRSLAARALGWIPVPLLTSDEAKPLTECKCQEDGVIWYVDSESNLADRSLIKQHPVVDAREHNIRMMVMILEKETQARVRKVPDPTAEMVIPLEESEVDKMGLRPFLRALQSCWRGPSCMAHFALELGNAFLHVSMPSLTLADEEIKDRLRGTPFEDMSIEVQRSFIRRTFEADHWGDSGLKPRLAINVDNEAIAEVVRLPADSDSITGVAFHLSHFAEHLSSKHMTREQLIAHSNAFTHLVLGLREIYAGKAVPPSSEPQDPDVRERRARWERLQEDAIVAVVYADLVGSSKLFSNLGIKDWDRVLNLYCEKVVDAVWDCGGVFDCFTGDGFIAMFPCDRANVSFVALEAVENIIQDVRRLFNRDSELKGILKSAGVKATGVSRYAITAGPVTIEELGGRITGTGVPMILGARLVADKALFDEDHYVVVAGSYVEADGAIEAVREMKACGSEHFVKGTYIYPDFDGARKDVLYRPC